MNCGSSLQVKLCCELIAEFDKINACMMWLKDITPARKITDFVFFLVPAY